MATRSARIASTARARASSAGTAASRMDRATVARSGLRAGYPCAARVVYRMDPRRRIDAPAPRPSESRLAPCALQGHLRAGQRWSVRRRSGRARRSVAEHRRGDVERPRRALAVPPRDAVRAGVGLAHRYGEATAKRCHSPGTPLSSCAPRSSNSSPEPITRSRSVLDTSTSLGPASALTRAPMCTAIPPMSSPADLALAGVQPGAHLEAERLHRVADRHVATDRSLRAVEHRQEAVARRVHLAAAKSCELRPDDSVVCVKQGVPVTVADLHGCRPRIRLSTRVFRTIWPAGGCSVCRWSPTLAASTPNGARTPPLTVSAEPRFCESRDATSIFSPLDVVSLDLMPRLHNHARPAGREFFLLIRPRPAETQP